MLDERHLAPDEELDLMVLTARAIEGHLVLYTPAQVDVVMPYLRGLCAYEASRPAARQPRSNVLDSETVQRLGFRDGVGQEASREGSFH